MYQPARSEGHWRGTLRSECLPLKHKCTEKGADENRNDDVAIVVHGEPADAIRDLDESTDENSWSQGLGQPTASRSRRPRIGSYGGEHGWPAPKSWGDSRLPGSRPRRCRILPCAASR